jgi:molybdopterin/thiamine biosynthesis adenylyltransferase
LRQEIFFGKEGQEKLGRLKVAIIGLGGIGSHVAQQLAYLGVRNFVLVDHDKIDGTNLNRLIGASEKDLGVEKVKIAARGIMQIQEATHVQPIDEGLLSKKAIDAIKESDFVFGCVDEDGVRLVLLEACCAFKKPLLDLASDVPDENTFGGRVVFTGIGKGCLKCRDEIDDDQVDWYFSSPEQRKEKEHIYGVRKGALGTAGPSVVFLNGVIASVGVQEFAVFVNPVMRKPIPYLEYRGNMGLLLRPQDQPKPGCFFCETIWNAKTTDDVYRYVSGPK